MNTPVKLLITLFLLTGLSACTATDSISRDSEQIITDAADIAGFDLPAGYGPAFSVHMMGYTVAGYKPADHHSHLYLIQSSNENDSQRLEQLLADLVPGASEPGSHMEVIVIQQALVRGQETTLTICEGINSDGETYREAIVPFRGNGGPALVVLSEPLSRWSQETVDLFITSIH